MWLSGWRRWLSGWRAGRSPAGRRARPQAEPLEDRQAPAVLTWTGQAAALDGNDNWSAVVNPGYGGGIDTNWTSSDSRSPAIPQAGDDLVFPAGALSTANNNDYPADTSFNSITFTGRGYDLTGNAVSLAGPISDNNQATNDFSTDDTISLDIQLPSGITVNGPAGNNTLALDGVLSGAGGLTATGSGTVSLGGPTVNIYTGTTQVSGGTLSFDKAGAIAGPLVVGPGTNGAATAQIDVNGATTAAIPVTLNGGVLAIGQSGTAVQDTIGALTFNGGSVDLEGPAPGAAGTVLTLGGDVSASAGSFNSISTDTQGTLSLGNTPRTFDVGDGAFVDVSTTVDGTAAATLIKSGPGTLSLDTANTYQGATDIDAGVVQIEDGGALGTGASGATVNSGATLEILNGSGGLLDVSEPLTLNGSGFNGTGALQSNFFFADPPNQWSGPITLATDSVVNAISYSYGDAPLTLTGPISGPGGLTKIGGASLTLAGSAPNTYSGPTYINAGQLVLQNSPGAVAVPGDLVIGTGTGPVPSDSDGDTPANDSDDDGDTLAPPGSVQLQASEQIADTANVTVNSDGLLDLNGFSETIGSLAGSGQVLLDSASGSSSFGQSGPPPSSTPGTLTVGANGLPTVFAGVIQGDGGNLVKVGGGIFTLAGANTYTGTTTVSGGTLLVDGPQPDSAGVVNAGGILGGNGIVGPTTVNAGGVVSPGDSPGVLSVQGGVTFNPGSVLFAELNGTAAGAGYDALNVVGPVVLNNPTLRLAVGFTPSPRQDFVLIANNGSGPIMGGFAGAPEDALLAHGNKFFDISYAGDVDLLSQSRDDLFVRALFADLDLASNRATRDAFEAQAESSGRALVAQELLGSPQRRLGEVGLLYTVFAQPNDGLQGRYVAQLLAGVPAGQVLMNFVSSRSFRRAHPSNRTFLRELFTALLDHPPGRNDVIGGHTLTYYLGQLDAGTITRGQLVLRLLSSDEVYAAAVQQNFKTLLGMAPTAVQLQALTSQLLAGGLTPDALTQLIVTQEAYIDYFIARAAAGQVPGVALVNV